MSDKEKLVDGYTTLMIALYGEEEFTKMLKEQNDELNKKLQETMEKLGPNPQPLPSPEYTPYRCCCGFGCEMDLEERRND